MPRRSALSAVARHAENLPLVEEVLLPPERPDQDVLELLDHSARAFVRIDAGSEINVAHRQEGLALAGQKFLCTAMFAEPRPKVFGDADIGDGLSPEGEVMVPAESIEEAGALQCHRERRAVVGRTPAQRLRPVYGDLSQGPARDQVLVVLTVVDRPEAVRCRHSSPSLSLSLSLPRGLRVSTSSVRPCRPCKARGASPFVRSLESFAPPEKPPQLWDLRQVRRVAPIFLAILAIRRRLCPHPIQSLTITRRRPVSPSVLMQMASEATADADAEAGQVTCQRGRPVSELRGY